MLQAAVRKRLPQRVVGALAAIAYLFASLQIAAPLHAFHCAAQTHRHAEYGGLSFEGPLHDMEHCPICNFLFGLTGKTIAPEAVPEFCGDSIQATETAGSQDIFAEVSAHRIIPRAPPV